MLFSGALFCPVHLSYTWFLCPGKLSPLKDSTSGPHNPFWGPLVILWILKKWPPWKMPCVLEELPGNVFYSSVETGPIFSWKLHLSAGLCSTQNVGTHCALGPG